MAATPLLDAARKMRNLAAVEIADSVSPFYFIVDGKTTLETSPAPAVLY